MVAIAKPSTPTIPRWRKGPWERSGHRTWRGKRRTDGAGATKLSRAVGTINERRYRGASAGILKVESVSWTRAGDDWHAEVCLREQRTPWVLCLLPYGMRTLLMGGADDPQIGGVFSMYQQRDFAELFAE